MAPADDRGAVTSLRLPDRANRVGSRGCWIAVAVLVVLVLAALQAGIGGGVVNGGGLAGFARFWSAAAKPELAAEFLRLTADAAVITLAYAVLGTALAVLIGAVGAVLISELVWGRGVLRRVAGSVLAFPRSIHEILWALLAIQILGFDPLVPILAIGLPFGAVTAKVFAEIIDEAVPGPFRQLRASGAGRLTALAYGVIPNVRGDLISYGFYRFECSIRSAAVLGVVGAGGLGFQLDLSFETLRYREIWTLILALMLLSGSVELWSSTVRRQMRRRSASGGLFRKGSLFGVIALLPLSWWWVGVDLTTLWSSRTGRLVGDLWRDLFPPRLGLGGWSELAVASIDTLAMSVLALALAVGGGLLLGGAAASSQAAPSIFHRLLRFAARVVLLLFRAVPAPMWAFLMVLVLFPGTWPGAVALGVYTLGVLGRLFAEAFEDADPGPATALRLLGAGPVTSFFYGTLPTTSTRLVSLALYRWEVIVRETVVVGVVGAGGLGQLINEHLAARDFAAVAGAIAALVVISLGIDAAGGVLRRRLRGRSGQAARGAQVPASSATTGAKSSYWSWPTTM